MTRIIGPPRSRRRRWTVLWCLAVALGAGLLFIPGALAVHDLQFQLDGNTATTCGTVPNCSAQTLDWNSLFNADGTTTSVIDPVNGPFTSASFVRDFGVKVSNADSCSLTNTSSTTFCTGDDTTFATGSKDTLNISTGWQCNHDNNVNSKIDIMNAYAASYTASNGDKILYFGLDKNKDNGNNNVGFWFLQGDAGCSTVSGTASFTGDHQDGDVLVVSAFTSGGGVSSITAYRWAGGATGCIDSHDNPNPKTGCDGLPIGNGGDCKTASGLDSICATTNSGTLAINGNITTTWLTADATLGVGHTVVPPDFFEGGINLTKVFSTAGGTVPSCFNTFIGDTRSSQSTTATLFDYARGVLGQCKTILTTKAGDTLNGGSASPSSIGTGSVSSGTDTATLTVTGTTNWGGTLTWYLCGPVSTDACDNTKGVQVTSRTVSNSSPATDFVSGTATLTSAGRYCWTAHFEPNNASKTAGVKAADDNGVGECFTVSPVTPTLTTCADGTARPCVPDGTVSFGSSVRDTADLAGAAKEPGNDGGNSNYPTINATNGAFAGSITFTLKGPASSGCGNTATGTGTNPQSVTVTGNTTYGPVSFTPGSPGTFHWQATYTNASAVNNSLPVSDNSNCDVANEDVTVQQITPTLSTRQFVYPQDKARIDCSPSSVCSSSGTGNLAGNVVFRLFDTIANCQNHGTETTVGNNGLLFISSPIAISGAAPQTATTSQTSAAVTAGATVAWRVTYTSTNQAQTDASASACTEQTTVSFAGNDTNITVP